MRVRSRVLLLALCALVAAGCGGGREVAPTAETVEGTLPEPETEAEPVAEGDAAAGKAIFTDNCGGCHALEAAGTNGTAGPNLDDSKPGREEAATQIRNGGNGMPEFKDQLTEKQIADVTAFVVESTGGE